MLSVSRVSVVLRSLGALGNRRLRLLLRLQFRCSSLLHLQHTHHWVIEARLLQVDLFDFLDLLLHVLHASLEVVFGAFQILFEKQMAISKYSRFDWKCKSPFQCSSRCRCLWRTCWDPWPVLAHTYCWSGAPGSDGSPNWVERFPAPPWIRRTWLDSREASTASPVRW